MSVELPGKTTDISTAASEVGFRVAKILKAEGSSDALSHTTGEKAGRYGAEIVMIALNKMDVFPADFDQHRFIEALDRVESDANIDAAISRRHAGRD